MKISVVSSGDVQFLVYQQEAEEVGSAQAALDGDLVLGQKNCLAVLSGEEEVGIVMPEGAVLRGQTLILPDGLEISVSDRVEFGGGYAERAKLPEWEPQSACGYNRYFIVNSD